MLILTVTEAELNPPFHHTAAPGPLLDERLNTVTSRHDRHVFVFSSLFNFPYQTTYFLHIHNVFTHETLKIMAH